MNATFDVEDDDGRETTITVTTDLSAMWGHMERNPKGAVEVLISTGGEGPVLMLRKSEARAIASALMGAAAEL